MGQQAQLISSIRFGFYGSRKMAAKGYDGLAALYRSNARRQIAELRALRAGGAA